MQIVNQTIPSALKMLGYADETDRGDHRVHREHGHVIDAPGLKPSTTRCSTRRWGSGRSSRWAMSG